MVGVLRVGVFSMWFYFLFRELHLLLVLSHLFLIFRPSGLHLLFVNPFCIGLHPISVFFCFFYLGGIRVDGLHFCL